MEMSHQNSVNCVILLCGNYIHICPLKGQTSPDQGGTVCKLNST